MLPSEFAAIAVNLNVPVFAEVNVTVPFDDKFNPLGAPFARVHVIVPVPVTSSLVLYCLFISPSDKFKSVVKTWKLFLRENISFLKKVYCFVSYIYYAVKRRLSF